MYRVPSRTRSFSGGGPGLMLLSLVSVTIRSLTTEEGERGRGLVCSTLPTPRWRRTRGSSSLVWVADERVSLKTPTGGEDRLLFHVSWEAASTVFESPPGLGPRPESTSPSSGGRCRSVSDTSSTVGPRLDGSGGASILRLACERNACCAYMS